MTSKQDINDITYFKKNIREYIKQIRSNINKDDAFLRGYSAYKTLKDIVDIKKIETISCYLDFNNEINTGLFVLYCLENKVNIVVPKIYADDIKFKYISNISENLIENKYGILEPDDSAADCDIKDIDIFIIPALAFDEKGARLGYGKGYYDRVFKQNKEALRIGLCYNFQVLPFLLTNEFDEIVDIIITEHKIIIPSNSLAPLDSSQKSVLISK